MIGVLPTTLDIAGTTYEIVTDFRAVLEIFEMFMDDDIEFEDSQMEQMEKWICCVYLLFKKYESMDEVEEDFENGTLPIIETTEKIKWFINAGQDEDTRERIPVYDWVADEQLIFSAVNDVARTETRTSEYIHWWTFLGYFNQIGEGLFSTVIHIRDKINNGKKLEKYEQQFVNEHSQMFVRKTKVSKERQAILDKLNSGEMFE